MTKRGDDVCRLLQEIGLPAVRVEPVSADVLGLNALLGWWWADPAAGYVLVFYAAREVREIFFARRCGSAAR